MSPAREGKTAFPTPLRRLDAIPGAGPTAIIFAPLPSAQPTVGAALDVLRCLAAAPPGHQPLLWLSDWSAFCLNCLSGGKTNQDDLTAIKAAYDLLLGCLKAIAPATMQSVRVVFQSQAILADSSNYWISVINIGRAHQLSKIRAIDEANAEVGQVISSLMHVADVLALSSSSAPRCICSLAAQQPLHQLALDYMSAPSVADGGLVAPSLTSLPALSLRLKAAADGAAAVEDLDAELLLLDGAPDVQRKMKKAFCEPGNVDFCPPLAIAGALVLPYAEEGKLVLKRREEDGGDRTYTDAAELQADFAAGALHPGDLKPSVRDAAMAVLQRVRAAVSSDAQLAKAEKEVVKVQKRAAKGGKGKK